MSTPEPNGGPAFVSSTARSRSRSYARRVLLEKPLTVGRAARIITTFTLLMTLLGGVVMHFADSGNFPNVWDGLWWSVQTVTTVGYGDHVPTNALGRAVASLVMLAGIGFLTVITATITSAFIESARRRLDGVEMRTLDAKLDALAARLETIEGQLSERTERGGGR
jgi:voltage-gated potassium channel